MTDQPAPSTIKRKLAAIQRRPKRRCPCHV